MGMFHNVIVSPNIWLPEFPNTSKREFQSKDEVLDDCHCTTTYLIDGRFKKFIGDWEVDNPMDRETVDLNFHGIFNFYRYEYKGEGSYEYHAKYTDGNLIEICVGELDDER